MVVFRSFVTPFLRMTRGGIPRMTREGRTYMQKVCKKAINILAHSIKNKYGNARGRGGATVCVCVCLYKNHTHANLQPHILQQHGNFYRFREVDMSQWGNSYFSHYLYCKVKQMQQKNEIKPVILSEILKIDKHTHLLIKIPTWPIHPVWGR